MFNWIKSNKFVTVVLLVAVYLFLQLSSTFFGIDTLSLNIPDNSKTSYPSQGLGMAPSARYGALSESVSDMTLPSYPVEPDYAPQAGINDRLVVQESYLSLLVRNVVETRNKILEFTNAQGGYMVNATTNNPEETPTGTVIVRIPADKLQSALDYFHSLSIKVVNENLVGTDVTDQYVDIDKRIEQLEKTKAKLEAILDQATEISDITNLTQQILNYQNQIDNWKGQQEALKKNAQLAKLTIYLSTDEIALPYTPSETFRPNVIFKLAVRSMVRSLRGLAELAIWLGVYSVIWVPALLLFIFLRKWWAKRQRT